MEKGSDQTEMDEVGKRDVHFYLSSLYMSICIYITLSVFIWTHTLPLTTSSLTQTDGKGMEREKSSPALLLRPSPLVRCFLSASLTLARPPVRTNQRCMYM